jgi:hypothetical protein
MRVRESSIRVRLCVCVFVGREGPRAHQEQRKTAAAPPTPTWNSRSSAATSTASWRAPAALNANSAATPLNSSLWGVERCWGGMGVWGVGGGGGWVGGGAEGGGPRGERRGRRVDCKKLKSSC